MPHHVFVHLHRQEFVAVVDTEGQAHELRQDGRAARPDLDDFVAARAARRFRLREQIAVDERTFPDGTCHLTCLYSAHECSAHPSACWSVSFSPSSAGPTA